MNNLPWIEKYRPETLGELMGQDNIVKTVKQFINNDDLPHLLFYGIAGTGKTSCALAISKILYQNDNIKQAVLELNASDQRGIDFVRTNIKNFAETRIPFSENKIKLIILDEADNMTKDAQFALRGVIEKYSKNVRFCLICNYASKLIPAIQSRCTRFRFKPLKKELIIDRIKSIAEKEGVDMNDDGLDALINIGQGDMRKIINTLQSTSLAFNNIVTHDNIYSCVGKPTNSDISEIFNFIKNKSLKDTSDKISELVESGLDISDILTEISNRVIKHDHDDKIYNRSCKITMLKELAKIEERVASDCSTELQVYGLASVFY